jgi:hypothetical protein
LSRYYIEDVATVPGQRGELRAVAGAKVYLFAAGTGLVHPEPTIPSGGAVTGGFFTADSGGSQLNSVNAWGPITTDSNGHWEAYFDTLQRVDVVYSSNNGLATVVGTSQSVSFAQYKDTQGMSASVAGGGGTTTIAVQDSAGTPLGNMSTLKVVGGDVDFVSSTAILNLLGTGSKDYVIVKELDGTYSAKRKDSDQHLYNNADWGVVLNAIDAALVAAGVTGAATAYAGSANTAVAIAINADGHQIHGPGFAEAGDLVPGKITLAGISGPYAGGLGTTPWITIHGNSCGFNGCDFDANNLARKALYVEPTVSSVTHGRNFSYFHSAVAGGTDYTCDWEGDDGAIGGWSRMVMSVGGDGTHGVAVWNMQGADINASNCHIHGSGVGASGRVAIAAGQTGKYTGVHFESGNANTNAWVLQNDAEKGLFTGCFFGHQEAGGEVLVNSNSMFLSVGCQYHCDTDLNATNTYDMLKLNAATSRLTMVGNSAFIGAAANNWRYAINNAGPGVPSHVIGNRFRAVTGAWNAAPTIHGGNTLEGLVIPGNMPTTSGFVKTLTDAASVTVDCSQGDIQVLTTALSRAMANPTNIVTGSRITFVFVNTSGGNITPTAGTKYKLAAGAFPTIGAGKIRCVNMVSYDGVNLYEESRTSADI